MKPHFVTLLLCLFTSPLIAQADAILGTWFNEPKDAKIKVYQRGDKYYGKIIWLKANEDGPTKLDLKNEDESKRSRPIVGINIVTGLEWDPSEEEWNDGEIYDPRSGSTYSVYATLESKDRLFIKGYIGFSLIGKSTYWTRVD